MARCAGETSLPALHERLAQQLGLPAEREGGRFAGAAKLAGADCIDDLGPSAAPRNALGPFSAVRAPLTLGGKSVVARVNMSRLGCEDPASSPACCAGSIPAGQPSVGVGGKCALGDVPLSGGVSRHRAGQWF